MSLNGSCNNKEVTQTQCHNGNNGYVGGASNFVIVIVLYILLAIIVGSYII